MFEIFADGKTLLERLEVAKHPYLKREIIQNQVEKKKKWQKIDARRLVNKHRLVISYFDMNEDVIEYPSSILEENSDIFLLPGEVIYSEEGIRNIEFRAIRW